MGFVERIDRHAGLVQQMAATVGVDLAESMARGVLYPEELRAAVFQCMGCGCARACDDWLAAHADGAAEAPGYCRNRDLLGRLRG